MNAADGRFALHATQRCKAVPVGSPVENTTLLIPWARFPEPHPRSCVLPPSRAQRKKEPPPHKRGPQERRRPGRVPKKRREQSEKKEEPRTRAREGCPDVGRRQRSNFGSLGGGPLPRELPRTAPQKKRRDCPPYSFAAMPASWRRWKSREGVPGGPFSNCKTCFDLSRGKILRVQSGAVQIASLN